MAMLGGSGYLYSSQCKVQIVVFEFLSLILKESNLLDVYDKTIIYHDAIKNDETYKIKKYDFYRKNVR